MSIAVVWTFLLALGLNAVHTNGQSNNTVNEEGKIVWGELAPDKDYKTTGYKASQGGLDPYYNMAKGFIGVCLAEKLPVDELKELMKGNDFLDHAKNLALNYIPGYVVCIVIGILFIIIFLIVGLCFCCCRCCGNCGGKREQKVEPNARCRRIGFGIAVIILSLFVIAGAACVFVSSDQVSRNVDTISDTLNNSVNDISIFFDNVDQSFTRLADYNFKFLTDVVDGYVTNASARVSDQLVKGVSAIVNLDKPVNDIKELQAHALGNVTKLSLQTTRLKSQRSDAVKDLQNSPSHQNTLNSLPIDDITTKLKTFENQVSADVFGQMSSDIDKRIRTTIASSANKVDVKGEMDPIFQNNILPMLENIRDMKTTMSGTADDMTDKLSSWIDTAKPYDKYRWIAGVALASLILLMALLALVGVFLGLCGGSVQDKPTERDCASNCGGILLMSAAGLIFIFGSLLMLLTTVMYAVGAPLQRYGCESVQDMKKLESYASLFDNEGFDPRNLTVTVADETITVSASMVMDSCHDGKTLYHVLGLKKVLDKGLEKVDDFKTNGLTSGLNFDPHTLGKDLGAVTLDVNNAINNLTNTVSIVDDVIQAIDGLHSTITSLASQVPFASLKSMASTLTDMKSTATELKKISTGIESNAKSIPPLITRAQNALASPALMENLAGNATHKVQNDVFAFVDSYADDLRTKMANDVGKCTPLYSIVNAVLVEALCRGIVEPMNGFWLAIGWSIFFFIPSLILSVKLAKYFRRMLYDTSYDSSSQRNGSAPLATMPSGKRRSPSFAQSGRSKVSPI